MSSDSELVRAAAAGQTQACETLVRRWAARVLAVCRSRVRSDAAEDLAQESLLRAVKGIKTLADPDKFGPWVCGIAHRTCLDWLKSWQRTEVSYDAMPNPPQPIAREPDEDSTQQLMAEVAKLPNPLAETLTLYYAQNYTYDELAALMGVSAATINARLTKARRMLREKLYPKDQIP